MIDGVSSGSSWERVTNNRGASAEAGDDEHGVSYRPPILPKALDFLKASGIEAQIAADIMASSMDDRAVGRQERSLADKIADSAERRQVSAMRDAADDKERAAWVQGGTQMASGFCGGDKSPAGQIIGGVGTGVAGSFDAESKRDDATATEAANRATHARAAGKDARDDVADSKKLMEDALKFVRQFFASKDEEARALRTKA